MMLQQTVWFYLVLKTLFTEIEHSFSIDSEHSIYLLLTSWSDMTIRLFVLVAYLRLLWFPWFSITESRLYHNKSMKCLLWQLNISSVYVYSCLSLRLSVMLQKVFYLCPINLRFFLLLKLFITKINFLNLKL